CSHFGKTPPCADMIVDQGFKKAVIACLDPFAKVNGLGIKKLQEAGIEVEVGLYEQAAKWLNRRFFTKIKEFRPYVILKWAETSDGYFAPFEGQHWISNNASQQLVHKWRSEEDAILVGKRTAEIDNPSLTTREWEGKNPIRILIDKNLDLPENLNILNDNSETIIFNAKTTDWKGRKKYIELENFDLYLPQQILYQLYLMDIQSIIVEGGRKTLDLFIQAGLWDEARVFVGAESWAEGIQAPKLIGDLKEEIQVGSDQLKIYLPN